LHRLGAVHPTSVAAVTAVLQQRCVRLRANSAQTTEDDVRQGLLQAGTTNVFEALASTWLKSAVAVGSEGSKDWQYWSSTAGPPTSMQLTDDGRFVSPPPDNVSTDKASKVVLFRTSSSSSGGPLDECEVVEWRPSNGPKRRSKEPKGRPKAHCPVKGEVRRLDPWYDYDVDYVVPCVCPTRWGEAHAPRGRH